MRDNDPEVIGNVRLYEEYRPASHGFWEGRELIGYLVDNWDTGDRRQVPDILTARELARAWAARQGAVRSLGDGSGAREMGAGTMELAREIRTPDGMTLVLEDTFLLRDPNSGENDAFPVRLYRDADGQYATFVYWPRNDPDNVGIVAAARLFDSAYVSLHTARVWLDQSYSY